MKHWIRREPTRAERWTTGLVSLALGAAVGAAALYLGRILVARDPVELRPPEPERELPPGRETS